ncbi:MAG TPA: TRAM domain-containing protein [Candidatus Omnitrophota bacterium]|nr:TRAM domain-containing protein [Candidatus Omnitrophota bacterium]
MTLSFIRAFFLIISGVVGYYVGELLFQPLFGLQVGTLCGLFLIFVESRLRRVSVRGLSSVVFGLLLGLFMAKLLADIISLLPLGDFILSVARVVLTVIFSYLGAVMALRGKDEFNIIIPYVRFRRQDVKEGIILLDTSAIIDGRIADIYKLNFLIGRLVVPRFVLLEMQKLADSGDDIKRQRGRRGLELLKLMQNDPKVDVHIHEDEMTEPGDVDAKLVSLAKLMDARICTTDFNLGQTASLQHIEVLNMNELASSVKSVVFIGEELDVKLTREGKEASQAVGYMDDGTMVVVSDARKLIGQNVCAAVTSVLQTQSGKMIFAKLSQR